MIPEQRCPHCGALNLRATVCRLCKRELPQLGDALACALSVAVVVGIFGGFIT